LMTARRASGRSKSVMALSLSARFCPVLATANVAKGAANR
jgi:hypothetical protein